MNNQESTHSQTLEERISAIEVRNTRVEADKAWETSHFRIGSIVILTYLVASLAIWSLGSTRPLLDAIIPTVGFTLSTLSLPPLKRWWVRRHQNN